jgi:hypothetical protein
LASGLAAAQLIAVRSRLRALSHCHIAMRFLLAAGQAFIGHIAIWILLVILPFGFYWSYCHLVLRAEIMLIAFCAG